MRRIVQLACLTLFLVLFFTVCRPGARGLRPQPVQTRELLDAELFLRLDPLVSVTSAIAARAWVASLVLAAAVVAVCVVFPRAFCGYVCPMGTSIDVFDWLIGRRAKRLRVRRRGWWVHARYGLLAAVLLAAALGVQSSGAVAPIPVLTRGLHFVLSPWETAWRKGWDFVPGVGGGHVLSVALFALIPLLGLLAPRFWCRCVCPSGALLSLVAAARLTDRKVTPDCVACGKCKEACSFGAVCDDFSTRPADCTFCLDCSPVCPTGAIRFVTRWTFVEREDPRKGPEPSVPLSRRELLAGLAGGAAAGLGIGAVLRAGASASPVRPPGSVPEGMFRALCVRCGSCIRACPTGVLQPLGFRQGPGGLWSPHADTDLSGCDPNCNRCGHVCPTGAIRALPPAEKQAAHMGLAVVDERTCLPHAAGKECRWCIDVCEAAGHGAIEILRLPVELDGSGRPIEDSGYVDAPMVAADRCVGCGLCQARCHGINVRQRGVLAAAAIRVEAGEGRDDRIAQGSYRALRAAKGDQRAGQAAPATKPGGGYVTDFP